MARWLPLVGPFRGPWLKVGSPLTLMTIVYPRKTPPHTRTAQAQPPAAHRRRHSRRHHLQFTEPVYILQAHGHPFTRNTQHPHTSPLFTAFGRPHRLGLPMVVCVECLPADKPWDCDVCDTPELWRGAAGLCARVRACAGAAESLHT